MQEWISTLDREGVPTLDGGGSTYLGQGRRGTYLGWGRGPMLDGEGVQMGGSLPWMRRGTYLGQGERYLPWMGEGIPTLDRGEGTYLGWGEGVPPFDRGGGVPTSDGERVPTLDGAGATYIGRGRGYLPWTEGVPTLDGGGVPTLDRLCFPQEDFLVLDLFLLRNVCTTVYVV